MLRGSDSLRMERPSVHWGQDGSQPAEAAGQLQQAAGEAVLLPSARPQATHPSALGP
jgi:hypothetical protein